MRITARTALAGGLVLLALLLGSWVVGLFPSVAAVHDRPFERPGAVGDRIALRTGDLTVRGAAVGSTLTDAGGGAPVTTTGAWVVVDYRFGVRDRAQSTTGATLVDASGRVFGATGLGCGPLQPGLPRACMLAFEVPSDAVGPGLVFRFPASSTERADNVAVVALGPLPAARPTVELATSRYVTAEKP